MVSRSVADPNRRMLPRAQPLNTVLTVCDVSSVTPARRLLAISLQGVVNQMRPSLYLLLSPKYDTLWLNWLQQRGYVRDTVTISAESLLRRYRSAVRGCVVYDSAFRASVNIATMLAGLERLVVLAPELLESVSLPVVHDLRGRWTDNAAAYRWAIEHLFPRMHHGALCSLEPHAAGYHLRDYLVQQRIFPFWVSGDGDRIRDGAGPEERAVIESLFRQTPPNAAVTGFWSAGDAYPGVSEYGGLVWAGGFGKPTICHDWGTNGSIHSAVRVDPSVFRQRTRPSPPKLERDRIYLSVSINESGDAPWYWQMRQRDVWDDPNRGKVPISWCVGGGAWDIYPGILEWYYRNATPNDYFYAAVSGAAYMMPPHYATRVADPEAVWRDWYALTDLYMQRLDLDMVALHMDAWTAAPTQYEDSAIFRGYASHLPRLRAILSDFGRMEDLDLKRANHYTARGVPVFHCLTRWHHDTSKPYDPAETLVAEIRACTPPQRPAFMHTMALSWRYTPTDILKARMLLGKEYVFVTARDLDTLYRQAYPPG